MDLKEVAKEIREIISQKQKELNLEKTLNQNEDYDKYKESRKVQFESFFSLK